MTGMFGVCLKLTNLDSSSFDTSNVTDMQSMFAMCGLTSLDLSHFDTSNVTNMAYMFSCCEGLTSLDVSNFDTSNVTNMSYMFAGNNDDGGQRIQSLDLSNFDTTKVTDMTNMFYWNRKTITIYVGDKWSTGAVTSGDGMFGACLKLVGGAGTVYDSNNITYAYAKVDGGTADPGYFTYKAN